MSNMRAIAGCLALAYHAGQTESALGPEAWAAVGRWYSQLTAGRRQVSPEVKQKALELTAGRTQMLDKVKSMSAFVQHEIRYAAIEIGIGGYQPHPAADVLANRYGDCKDKATLLTAMLQAIGIDSYYVLVHSGRGVVMPEFPSMLNFDHVIVAIGMPGESEPLARLYVARRDQRLGWLLLFDPTDTVTPFEELPAHLQGGDGLLVRADGGELIHLPLAPASSNRVIRETKAEVRPDGTLAAAVAELSWGAPGARRRGYLLAAPAADRVRLVEELLAASLGAFSLRSAEVGNLDSVTKPLLLRGGESRPRRYPLELAGTASVHDLIEITVPEGYAVDELPLPVEIQTSFGSYLSKCEAWHI